MNTTKANKGRELMSKIVTLTKASEGIIEEYTLKGLDNPKAERLLVRLQDHKRKALKDYNNLFTS